MRIRAYAKLNLTLDVLGKRPDGYHDLRMLMQTVALADEITLTPQERPGVRVQTNLHFLPNNEKNLAAQAALRFLRANSLEERGFSIDIEKKIPVCAGLAGGSSDAAAVLRGLNEMLGTGLLPAELARLGQEIGSDVPYCVTGGTALAEGRGEVLTALPPLPPCWVVLCKPEFSISTPALFAGVDSVRLRCRPDTQGAIDSLRAGDLAGVARRMYNVFEDVLPDRQRARVADIKNVMVQCGALGASMSGTGPTAFGLFPGEAEAREARDRLLELGGDTFLTQTV